MNKPNPHHKTCGNCGHTAEPKRAPKGTMRAEIFLWIVFFPVGLLYSLWRVASKRDVCPACGSELLVPSRSGAAEYYRKLFNAGS